MLEEQEGNYVKHFLTALSILIVTIILVKLELKQLPINSLMFCAEKGQIASTTVARMTMTFHHQKRNRQKKIMTNV